MKYMTMVDPSPARSTGIWRRSVPRSGVRPFAFTWASHRMNAQPTKRPTITMGMTGEKPAMVNGGSIGSISPHELALTRASTTRPIASADSATPTKSNRLFAGRRAPSPICRTSGRIATRMMMVSAPNTQRHEKYVVTQPPMSGPAAAAAPAIPPRMP